MYAAAAAGLAGGVQRRLRRLHQLPAGVQGVLQPEEAMGTLHPGQHAGSPAQVSRASQGLEDLAERTLDLLSEKTFGWRPD